MRGTNGFRPVVLPPRSRGPTEEVRPNRASLEGSRTAAGRPGRSSGGVAKGRMAMETGTQGPQGGRNTKETES